LEKKEERVGKKQRLIRAKQCGKGTNPTNLPRARPMGNSRKKTHACPEKPKGKSTRPPNLRKKKISNIQKPRRKESINSHQFGQKILKEFSLDNCALESRLQGKGKNAIRGPNKKSKLIKEKGRGEKTKRETRWLGS